MSCEQHEALDKMFQSEEEPYTKRILRALGEWWNPPYGFRVSRKNYFNITPGTTYDRSELYAQLLGGWKKDKLTDKDREMILHANKVVFNAMLMLDDRDPTFEPTFRQLINYIG